MGAITHHQTSVTIRLAGRHDTLMEVEGQSVRVAIPGAMITIADKLAAWSIWKAWRDANTALRKIFPYEASAAAYRVHPEVLTLASIAYKGWVVGRDVQGKTPGFSPSGCGELIVRLGSLTIVCDDLDAAVTQVALWASVYDIAQREVWPKELGVRRELR